jgi:pimeloyl-ACP methyl ester carboxylesterase
MGAGTTSLGETTAGDTTAGETTAGETTIGAAFDERIVTAAGFDVRFLEAGPTGQAAAEPVVHLPGAGGPNLTIALDLLAARFRVAVVELPGWGAQPNPVDSFDDLATQTAEAIAAAGYDSYHLMGTSLGGACALHLASLFPDRVRSIVLEAPAKLREASTHPSQIPPDKFVAAFRAHPERLPRMAAPDPELMQRVWPLVDRVMEDGTLTDDFAARLAALPHRTLILFGHDDGMINPINGRTYRRLMKNSILTYVYDAAHDIQSDRPEAFADIVGDFLRRGMHFLINEDDGLINP